MSAAHSTLEYHRPTDLDEALALVGRPGAVILAGGTWVNAAERPRGHLLVDLQALGLDSVHAEADVLVIGAMTTLAALTDHAAAPHWLRDLARREQPSALRTIATLGGTLFAGGWESLLLAGLLAGDARATVVGREGTADLAVSELLAEPEMAAASVVTAVRVSTDGDTAVHSTARTTADRPIVGCVVRRTADRTRIALTGVASTPIVVGTVSELEDLAPPDDFRGSGQYRGHLARVLSARALAEIGAN